jgi:alcohol dehydrogenase
MQDVKNASDDIKTFVGIGGGSTLDFAKVLVESIGLEMENLKLVMIPTNIGSGAEVTDYASIWNFREGKKSSVAMSKFKEYEVIYEYGFMKSLNRAEIEIGLLDSLAHAYDSLLSKSTDKSLSELARMAVSNLNSLMAVEDDTEFLRKIPLLCHLSMISGYCINIAKTTLSHGLSYGLTLHVGIPHGLAVGLCLKQYLTEYQTELSPYIDEEEICMSVKVIERILSLSSLAIGREVNRDAIIRAIDWNKVENFVLEVDNQTAKSLLNRVLASIAT